MGLLDGKQMLVTGVLTDASIAFHVARLAQEQGADGGAQLAVAHAAPGRADRQAAARRTRRWSSSTSPSPSDLAAVPARVGEHLDRLDGVLHSIGFAPESALGGNFLNTEWADVATALQVSAYSLKSLTMACLPLMRRAAASVVGLDFDATVAWPAYDWMGVAKAGARVDVPLPRPRPRPAGVRVQPGRGRPDQDDGRQEHPRLRPVRVLGTSVRRSAGTSRTRSRPPWRAWRCCRTGSRPPPARSSTSTAVSHAIGG